MTLRNGFDVRSRDVTLEVIALSIIVAQICLLSSSLSYTLPLTWNGEGKVTKEEGGDVMDEQVVPYPVKGHGLVLQRRHDVAVVHFLVVHEVGQEDSEEDAYEVTQPAKSTSD